MSPTLQERDDFVIAQYDRLVRSARLLTGDPGRASDLVQETLVRVLTKWPQVARADDSAAYASRMMLNVFLAGRRRSWHREVPHGEMPQEADGSAANPIDDRDDLRRRLLSLPPRQRAAVVLRHYERLSEIEAAQALDCSVGTVKSLTSRGLATLRTAAASEFTRRQA